MRKSILFVPLFLGAFSSCMFSGGKRVKGNGQITKEQRTVSDFDKVEAHGNIDVYVIQGDLKPVEIEGDQNLLSYIELQQTGSRLVVRNRNGYNLDPSSDMKIYVTSPRFEEIEVSGACDIISEAKIKNDRNLRLSTSGAGDIRMDIDAPKIEAKVSGAGKVNLKGETKDFDLDLTGAGSARCYDLLSENTKVDISGAGSAEVYASVKLDAEVSGAGSVKYKGNAKSVQQRVSGAGSVSKTD
ncbi:MAG: DUF2807 domain-containing protein [Williamsia sp.]|nr:DUF2807 domain-containing protein [Williamsia sp.]